MGLQSQVYRGMKVLERSSKILPPYILAGSVGLVVITEVRGAMIISANIGRGFMIKRLSKYKWGFPSSVVCFGMGAGGQIGGEKIDLVLVINDEKTMKALESSVQLRLGAEYGIALGPTGVDGQGHAGVGGKGTYGVYSYSMAQGIFVGISCEGSFLCQNKFANRSFYKSSHSVSKILNGEPQLVGGAITCVDELHTFLYELVQNEHGMRKRAVLPLSEAEFETVEEDRKRFEKRRDSFKGTLAGSNKGLLAKAPKRRNTDATMCTESDESSDEEVGPSDMSDKNLPRSPILSSKRTSSGGASQLDIVRAVTNSQYAIDIMRMQDAGDVGDMDDEGWLERRLKIGATLVLKCDHVVDERDRVNAEHFLISARRSATVTLLDGSLETGLPVPYQDYVMVYLPCENGVAKIGRMSKFVLEPYSTNPFVTNPFS